MKFRWSIRKDSAFSFLGLAFALLALIFSLITVRLTSYLDFRLPNFLFNNGKQIAGFLRIAIHALCAASLLIADLCQCFGFGKAGILLSAVLLFISSLCNLGTDLYVALYVNNVAFYPFSLTYLDVLLSLLLLVLVVLTCLRVLRTTVPVILAGFAGGIAVSVLTILRIGCYGTPGMIDFSSMIFYLCIYVALSLCFMAWSKDDTPVPDQISAVPSAEAAAYATAGADVLLEVEKSYDAADPEELREVEAAEPATQQLSSVPFQTTTPAQSDEPVQSDAPTQPDVPVSPDMPAQPDMSAQSDAPAQPAAQDAMPLPMEGYVWTQIGCEPDGTDIFAQRRIFTDAKTGRQMPGPFAQVFYPHPPTSAMRPPVHAPQPAMAPPVVPPMQAQRPSDNTVQQINTLLQQLAVLHNQGILTDAEYSEKCKQILNRL